VGAGQAGTGPVSYRVEITRRAMKGLGSLPGSIRRDIASRLAALAENPRPESAESLRHPPLAGLWKLRCGDYRVVYDIDDAGRCVAVLRVGHRHNVYK